MLGRNPQWDTGIANLPLRAHESLREGRFRNDERACDLRRREAADEAQRQRDLRLGRERRVAAGEDQLQSLVRDRGLLVVRELRGAGEQLRFARECLLAADPVDRAVSRRGDDPGPGARRRALARPAFGRLDERVLNRVLGEVEVAEDAAEDRDAARTLVAVGTDQVVYSRYSELSTIGRISIVPERADGISDAHSIASSSESASMRQ